MPCRHYGHAKTIRAFYTAPMTLRIRELRLKAGLTQDELAGRAGMSRSQLAMIEAETRPANTLRLNSIAAALGVQPPELYERTDGQERLLSLMQSLTPADRDIVVRMAEALAAKARQAE